MATATEIKNFIQTLGKLAVAESNRRIAQGKGFVLPSVCIAQSALETGWGTSGLMTRANAYFGIKAGGSWTGAVYTADTWEVANGEAYNTTANFRAYGSLAESVTDYYDLISNSRYSNALSFGTNKSTWKTPKECITAIWSGGYATDTLYVEKIMSTVNARKLTEWDNLIDGVSTETDFNDFSFTSSDLVQGSLIITDSGRSVGNNTADLQAVALDWGKSFTHAGTFKISGLADFKMYVMRLEGDTPSLDNKRYEDGDTISFTGSQKVGFYLKRVIPNQELVGGGETFYNLTPENVNLTITFVNVAGGLIDNEPSYSQEIAYFVKIE